MRVNNDIKLNFRAKNNFILRRGEKVETEDFDFRAIEKQRAAEEKQQTPAYKKKKEIEKAEKWVKEQSG